VSADEVAGETVEFDRSLPKLSVGGRRSDERRHDSEHEHTGLHG
jgi:hypothetical protein